MDLIEVEYLASLLIKKYLNFPIRPYNFDWIPEHTNNDIKGWCDYSNRLICLNYNFTIIETKENVKKVLLHEISHALVGPKAKHGKFFRKKCNELGLFDNQYIHFKE